MAKDKSKSGRKIGRNKKHQAGAYKSGMRLERNRKRRWRRVLRAQPGNKQLVSRYETEIGPCDVRPSARAERKATNARTAALRRALKREAKKAESAG